MIKPADEQPIATVRPDRPLQNEVDDRLDRAQFAAAVARLISERSDPTSVVVAIYAPWGDGKTTVLNWVRQRVDQTGSGVVVVPFNPWLIRDEVAMLPTFFATLSQALGKRLGGRKADIAAVLKRYGSVVAGLSVGIPGVSFDPGETMVKLGEAMDGQSLEEMRGDFEAILRDADQRLLVIIDDVDRLDDDETHALFKLVKLAADFERVTYLMAFDEGRVAAALAKRHSSASRKRNEERTAGGFEFLEKIVQLPLRLPRARKRALDLIVDDAIGTALMGAGIQLNEREAREFGRRYAEGFSPAITSVRAAKRFASAASFALSLLKGETYPIDVLTIEGINVCYPSVYAAIRDHPSWFLLPYEFHLSHQEAELTQQARERLESVVESVELPLQEPVRKLVQSLFPQTQEVWASAGSGRERAEWAAQQRVCSSEYFERYFAYGVAATEVGDQELDDLLTDPAEYDAQVTALIARKGDEAIAELIEKADRRLARLEPRQLVALADAVISLGPRVATHNEPRFFARNLLQETAAFLARIALSLPEGAPRLEVATRAVTLGEPLLFASECLRWMTIKKSDADPVRAVDEGQARILTESLASRIAEYAESLDQPLWETPGGLLQMHLAGRGGQGAAMKVHVREWLGRAPECVITLLNVAAGQLYGADGVVQDDLTSDEYEALARIADTADLEGAVAAIRGAEPAPGEFPAVRYAAASGEPTDRIVLDQFAWHMQAASGTPKSSSG